jgi:hypothetical protein
MHRQGGSSENHIETEITEIANSRYFATNGKRKKRNQRANENRKKLKG